MTGALPRISIVTPSYNQAEFLEEAVRSVSDQGYSNLEHVIVDGGSTDGSVDIIGKHESHLTYWTSEPDRGMYDAINKGFARTTGEVMAWLNSDDKHLPWTLSVVSDIFSSLPEVEWLTSLYPLHADSRGRVTACFKLEGFNGRAFFRGRNLLVPRSVFATCWIPQEATFWRRSLWERAGGRLDALLRLAGDFELWGRFWKHAALYAVSTPLACYRAHSQQITAVRMAEYRAEARRALAVLGGREPLLPESLMRLPLRALPQPLLRIIPVAYRAKIVKHVAREHRWTVIDTRFV